MSNDQDSGEDEIEIQKLIKSKRFLLCKTLLDQTKELCHSNSAQQKYFDQIFTKIITRFTDWEIFEEKEIAMACDSLKAVAHSGQLINLIPEKNMKRIIQAYVSEDLHAKYRLKISETFLIIAKNIGLRKIFLNKSLHEVLVQNSFSYIDLVNASTQKNSSELIELYQNAVKLLCMVCTARKTQCYIPGETNLAERLRKRAFDSGTFTLLTYLHDKLKDVETEPFMSMGKYIAK